MGVELRCDTCPFTVRVDDPHAEMAVRGHETYLETHPRGWLGMGEAHKMAPVTSPQATRGRAYVCGVCWSILRPDEYEPSWTGNDDSRPCSMCGEPWSGWHRVAWSEIDAERATWPVR